MFAQPERVNILGTNTDTSWFSVSKPDINSPSADFCVTRCGQQYVFSSARTNHFAIRYFNGEKNNPLVDLYTMKQEDESTFTVPLAFSSEINSRSNNEGPVTFNRNGTAMVYTGSSIDQYKLVLYQSVQNGNHWSSPRVLPFSNDGFNYMHASYAFGDSVLFFASDRSGGFGGTDIYFVKITNEGWSQPINAGRSINSAANELFPFCSASGVLYFSSNRVNGKGGLDIYGIPLYDSLATRVELLAEPINSPADDFGFYISEDQREGFFSSNKGNAVSDDDIYYFRYNIPSVAKTDTLLPVKLCYNFYEEQTSATGDTVAMKYTWRFSDGDVHYGYSFDKCFDTIGEYEIVLNVRDSSGGDVIISDITYLFPIENPNYVSIAAPDSVKVTEEFILNTALSQIEGYEIMYTMADFGNGLISNQRTVMHSYPTPGIYFPRIYLQLRNKETGATETRCVVKKITVI